MLVPALIFPGFLLALIHPWLHRRTPRWSAAIVGVYPLLVTIILWQLMGTLSHQPITFSAPWLPDLGVNLSFRLDGLSFLFSVLITGVGFLVFLYAGDYFAGSAAGARSITILLVFLSSMLGLVCSDNLIILFVFWELTSICSYFLIGHKHESLSARKAALQALLVTGSGGLALLAGIIVLGNIAGTYEISGLIAQHFKIIEDSNYPVALVLILLAAFTKSAQFPFHFWLPGAMKAPTPVSSYLHSATMVKAGVFLLARLDLVLGGTALWSLLLVTFGAATMVLGAVLALVYTDLKRILAYSTVSALGTLVLLLGVGSALSIEAALAYVIVHALYKAALFMIAGTVDVATGTRDITKLRGLAKPLPLLAFAAAFAGLSMAGVPPFFGFVGKEMIYQTFRSGALTNEMMLLIAGFVANAITIAVVGLAVVGPFFRSKVPVGLDVAKPLGIFLTLSPLALALAGLAAGVWAADLGRSVIGPAANAVYLDPVPVTVKLWHGFNFILLLSGLTLIAGAVIFRNRNYAHFVSDKLTASGWNRYATPRIYERSVERLVTSSQRITTALQHGSHSRYLVTLIGATTFLMGAALFNSPLEMPAATPLTIPGMAAVGIVCIGAIHAVFARSRLAAILSIGGIGYGIALLYALLGAPDLAITQLLIETLTVVLFAFALARLPQFTLERPRLGIARDAILAGSFGLAMACGVGVITATPSSEPVSRFFRLLALAEGHGKNVVNVILVDFRALDTLGEITVLVIAVIGVSVLVARRRMGDVE